MPTIFTAIIEGSVPAHIIYRDENVIAFLDINPRSKGHTLVVPIREVQYLRELSSNESSALFDVVHQIVSKMTSILSCDDYSIIINDGPAAGQEIPHVHAHIIPRWLNDSGYAGTSSIPIISPAPENEEFQLLVEKLNFS